MLSRAAISQCRPTKRASARSVLREPIPSSRRAAAGSSASFDPNQLGLAKSRAMLDQPAVDSLSITPPDGAADSIRCAIPTCSPKAV